MAPICYVALFSALLAIHVRAQRSGTERSAVFAAMRGGAFFGVLYAVMALGPVAIIRVVEMHRQWEPFGILHELHAIAKLYFVPLGVAVHFAVFGAATGGLVGLVFDGRRRSRDMNPPII